MKVIVVGSGGREHAIAWKLAQSDSVEQIICAPGNGGTLFEKKCTNVNIDIASNVAYVEIAKANGCSLAVVGPEAPLADGLADSFWEEGIPCMGPVAQAARLEASKDFAKRFMKKYGVACAQSETFGSKYEALDYIKQKGVPIVIKADGLAGGKGVFVAESMSDAEAALEELTEEPLKDASAKIVVEEYLKGRELSVLAAVCVTKSLSDQGKSCIKAFLPARDHKRLCDGDRGPNTGGMGAFSPVDDADDEVMAQFNERILEPTLKGLIAEGWDYRGFIFFGLMLTDEGPKCLEYNVRLGDPEAQAVLPLMDFELVDLCEAIASGNLASFELKWKAGYQVAPVAASGGYPKSFKKGCGIRIDEEKVASLNAKVFMAGVIKERRKRMLSDAILITFGGRVLACSAHGDTFDEARKNAYEAMGYVKFADMFYRKDIGLPPSAK